ncbi:hypothetical protein IH824_16390 [candidate division KSB1 bacterium]|nr:hypothetical protein [candidate division KSB1 bacterium]
MPTSFPCSALEREEKPDNSGETSANDSGNMTIFNENAKVGEEDAWSF